MKTFRQRRPDGKGGWIYNLQGVRRVVYRLPDLKGHKAIIVVEGEKDADKAWSLGIPATTSPMGAGKWDPEYAKQIKAAGVERVSVVPDNDDVGAAHATTVAASLQKLGIEVRLVPLPGVPNHGDLSDYLASNSKEDFVALLKAAPVAEPITASSLKIDLPDKQFTAFADSRYTMEVRSQGIQIEVSRVRRSSNELIGELVVRVNGHFPNARTYQDGVLSAGDLNFSSVQARGTRAKLLSERSGDKTADWFGYLEEFVTSVIATERKGKPAVVLADVEIEDEPNDTWEIDGFPLLRDLPQVLFGDSASGKSYFAMYLAGKLAEAGVSVLYADWEFSQSEHKRRLQKLFQPMPRLLHYIRCEHPLKHETDHLSDLIAKHAAKYLICDSIGFAVEGPAESQEGASAYFRYLRQLNVGSLSIAHIPKQFDDAKEAQIFGSVFFKHGARSSWFIERAKEGANNEVQFGLYQRKNNIGAKAEPKAYKLVFQHNRTLVEKIDPESNDELIAALPMMQRIKLALADGPLSIKRLAEDLASTPNVIRAIVAKHKSAFMRQGDKISLFTPTQGVEF